MTCRQARESHELVRVGFDATRAWYVGVGTGRGVWWCASGDCWSHVVGPRVAKAMRRRIDDADVSAIRNLLAASADGRVVRN